MINWIEESIAKPRLNESVLLKVKKGKTIFITQGVLVDARQENASERSPYSFWNKLGYGLEYRDYSDRLIYKLNSKKPKSKVVSWSKIN